MTSRCNRPDCRGPGLVDETGFCDECQRRPLAAVVPDAPGGSDPPNVAVSMFPGTTSWLVGGLVSMPVLTLPDPSNQILSAPEVPEASRICGHCGAAVGRGYAGQPGLLEGYCPKCTNRFSFVPKLHPGDLVADQYEIVGCLARGGLGWVYLARDTHLDGNYVALKGLITNDEVALRLAVAERRFLTTIDHPNIVRIFNSVTHHDPRTGERTGYIVMEYLSGQSLQDIQVAAGKGGLPLPIEHVIAFGHEILAALEYLHGRGLLYCDMKPANVIRCPDRIKVIDVGGVRQIGDNKAPAVGTDFFQVPQAEIRTHGLTVRSDIHTVGKTLQALFWVSQEGRPARQTAPDDVGFGVESFTRLVERAVAGHDQRFATAVEMSQQLKGVLCEVLSLRTGQAHPVRSAVFAPTPVLLDGGPSGGLGAVPGLDLWIRGSTDLLDVGRPTPSSAASGLPVPLVDPDDDAVDLLATTSAADPRGLIEKLAESGRTSVEIHLALCRACLDASDPASAAGCLDAAIVDLDGRAAHDWRISWHRGLLYLARAEVGAAVGEFDAVYQACPGEIAPKLALGFCAEHLGDTVRAARCYQAIWRRDRGEGSAAFGLARIRLDDGDRPGAVQILDEVPRETLHYERARIAAVRILCGRLAGGGPAASDLAEAIRRLPVLRLDGGNETGESRDRLIALIRAAALYLARTGGAGDGLGDGGEVLGPSPTEQHLRRRLERSLRSLAGQARTIDDHGALVDLANSVRPRTLW